MSILKWNNLIILEGIREVKRGKSQFLSLFALSFLWIVIFAGLTASLSKVEDSFLELRESLMGYDLQILGDVPLNHEDLEKIQENYIYVQEMYELDIEVEFLTGNFDSHAVSYDPDGTVNQFHLLEGRLSENPLECMVSPSFIENTSVKIGDMIQISTVSEMLNTKECTIVGVGQSAQYLSTHYSLSKLGNGMINSQVYLHQDGFQGDYSSILIKLEENQDIITEKQNLQDILQEQWDGKRESYLAIEEERLREAENLLNDAQNEGQLEINTLNQEILFLEKEISNGWSALETEDDHALQIIKANESKYDEKMVEMQNLQTNIEEKMKIYRKSYQQAQRDYLRLEEATSYLEGKEGNVTFRHFYQDMYAWANYAWTIPTIFFCIFACISFFMMSRMMGEQRTLIGGLRGFGYKKSEIIQKYLAFSVFCGISSGVLANFLAQTVITYVIHGHWEKTYELSDFTLSFHGGILLFSVILSVISLIIATIVPFIFLTRGEAVTLLRPKAPVTGKHIMLEKNYMLWNDLNFNQKIALRSLFRKKWRLFSNIIAIAVTSALIITALAVQSTYPQGAQNQFHEIYNYTAEITAKDGVVEEEFLEIQGIFSEYGLNNSYVTLMCQDFQFTLDGEIIYGEYYVFDTTSDAEQVVEFRLGRYRPFYMPSTGAVLPIKLANILELQLGDSIPLETEDLMVTAVMEQYHEHRIYMTKDYYHWLTGENATHNKILLKLPPEINEDPYKLEELRSRILALGGTQSWVHLDTLEDSYTDSNNLVKKAMAAFFIASCILAYLVLNQLSYNSLLYRRRELATLKVLGFYDKELSAYVYRENIIYTFLGLVLGLVLGQNIYLWFVKSVETNNIMLYRDIAFHDYLRGAGLSVIFALVVNIFAHFKIKKLNMLEDLKHTE